MKNRILVITPWWPSDHSSAGNFVRDQTAALVASGLTADVVIVEPRRSSARQQGEYLQSRGVHIQTLSLLSLPRRGVFRHFGPRADAWLLRRQLHHLLPADGPAYEFTLLHHIVYAAAVPDGSAFGPLLSVVHGKDPFLIENATSPGIRDLFVRSARRLDATITVGGSLEPYVRDLLGESVVTETVHNGISIEGRTLKQDRPNGSDRFVRISSVSNLTKQKRVENTIRALAECRSREPAIDWKLDIVGEGPETVHLRELVRHLSLDREISFHGRVDRETTIDIMERSDIFCLPSVGEAFGMVYPEAMAVGTPVIASNDAGACETVREGVDGLLVPPDDIAALADALHRLSTNRQLRERMGKSGRTRAAHFTWERNAQRIRQIAANHERKSVYSTAVGRER